MHTIYGAIGGKLLRNALIGVAEATRTCTASRSERGFIVLWFGLGLRYQRGKCNMDDGRSCFGVRTACIERWKTGQE
jgi:hypothetical protein